MADNNFRNQINFDSSKMKNETQQTFNNIKDTVKNVNVKEDTKNTGDFIVAMCKDPLNTIEKIAKDNSNSNFKEAIIIAIIWTIASTLRAIFSYRPTLGNIIDALISPILGLIIMSIIISIIKNSNKGKSLTTILTTIVIAHIPKVLGAGIALVRILGAKVYYITNPIINFAYVLSIVFTFFAIKDLLGLENKSEMIKKFSIVIAFYLLVGFVLNFFGINIGI